MSRSLLILTLLPFILSCGVLDRSPDGHDEDEPPGEHDDHDDHDEEGDEGEGHADVVTLTAEAMEAARIVVAPAQRRTLSSELAVAARIGLDPRKEAVISAWVGGQVDAIRVRAGESVSKGTLLATVQTPELAEVMAAYRGALSGDQATDARLERLRRLEADGVSSRAQVLEAEAEHAEVAGALEAAEERLRILGVKPTTGDTHSGEQYPSHVPVKSPIAGKVLTASASAGQWVEPGDPLFHVGDLDVVWLLMEVYERNLPDVRVGQSVRFSVNATPGRSFEGQVDQVGDWIEPDARTVEVRVVVPNDDHALKPNMYAQATLTAAASDGAEGIVVPRDAVQAVEGRPSVFVKTGDGSFEARAVAVQERTSTEVLLASGVEEGEPIVVEGAFALRSEQAKSELGEGHAH